MDMTNICAVTSEVLPEIAALSTQLGYPVDLPVLRQRFEHLQGLSHHSLWMWKEQSVLGMIHLEEVSDLIEENKVEIKALVVSEANQSKGIGKALVIQARKWARERNCSVVYLNCNVKREEAHAFYQSAGFTLTKTSHFFELQV